MEKRFVFAGTFLLAFLTIVMLATNYNGNDNNALADLATGKVTGSCDPAQSSKIQCFADNLKQFYVSIPTEAKACMNGNAYNEWKLLEACDKGCYNLNSNDAKCVRECVNAPGTFYQQAWAGNSHVRPVLSLNSNIKFVTTANNIFTLESTSSAPHYKAIKVYDKNTGALLKDSGSSNFLSDTVLDFNTDAIGSKIYLVKVAYDSTTRTNVYKIVAYSTSNWAELFSQNLNIDSVNNVRLDRMSNTLYLSYTLQTSSSAPYQHKFEMNKITAGTTSFTIDKLASLDFTATKPIAKVLLDVKSTEFAVVLKDKSDTILRYSTATPNTPLASVKTETEGGQLKKVSSLFYDRTNPNNLFVFDNSLGTEAGTERFLRVNLLGNPPSVFTLNLAGGSLFIPLNMTGIATDSNLYLTFGKNKNKIEKYGANTLFDAKIFDSTGNLVYFDVDNLQKGGIYVYNYVPGEQYKVKKYTPC